MKSAALLLFFLPCAMLLTGCAGGICKVTANSVAQPVSCTARVFDASGRIVEAQPNQVVQHVTMDRSKWTVLWEILPLNGRKWDISNELNAMLKKTPGNAVVNLTVTAQGCNPVQQIFAVFLPVIPCYVHVVVHGDIVQIPQAP